MAKGRRLTISRSERYLGSYAGHSYTNNVSESPELREEDVWSMVEGGSTGGVDDDYYGNGEAESEWETLAVANPPPMPSRDRRQVGGLALAFEEFSTSSRIVHQLRPQDGFAVDAPPSRRQLRQVASSAPVNVPDWKKILRVNSVESMNDSDDGELEYERDSAVDPPHEYLARSRSKDATSVFEGVGRTLKGRDMRRLRDTVWSQTGFDG